jgi:3-oxoadipate enol-lactonase
MGAMIRDVERLIDHFALKDAVVLGAGEGGLIAQGLAIKRLDLVRAHGPDRLFHPVRQSCHLGKPSGQPALRSVGPDLDAECAALLGPRWRQSPALPLTREMLETTGPEGWQGLAAAISTADFYQTTATLKLPTLTLAGSDDRKTPPDLQRETADLIAGSDFHLIRGGSHLTMLDRPASLCRAASGLSDPHWPPIESVCGTSCRFRATQTLCPPLAFSSTNIPQGVRGM